MNRNEEPEGLRPVAPDPGYAAGQLASALRTAATHEDAATRRRARERSERWQRVLAGMADGSVTVGSRAPVAGLPAWTTPEVVRGGFATGAAAAALPAGADGRADFAGRLTDAGLDALIARLDAGDYVLALPEDAALLTVAWLVRAGDRAGALELLDEIGPFADRLRFVPEGGAAEADEGADPEAVHRSTAGEARGALAARRRNPRIDTLHEALAVWNPFTDEVLAHWLAEDRGTPEWRRGGARLLARYRALAGEHTLCRKHRRPGENLHTLLDCLRPAADGRALTPRQQGLLRHALESMTRKRGAPGTERHAALRARQAADAARPAHHALAQVAVRRLALLPEDAGVPDIDPLLGPVTAGEAAQTGVPAGSELPEPVRRIVARALSAPVRELIARGLVPSAEVLAELVPQLVASATALAYPDPALRALMAAHHRAFHNRRGLLLLNLEHQVREHELPWVRAVSGHRDADGAAREGARQALVHLAELALDGFAGTILPNPLVSELGALARAAGVALPLTEELAADIFMGTFTAKFASAARIAAELLDGTAYARYYGLDPAAAIADLDGRGFGRVCHERAGVKPGGWGSVAENGSVVEQGQILTTHNLAALVAVLDVRPAAGWGELARRACAVAAEKAGQTIGNRRPLRVAKDAGYAWRQAVFFLALAEEEDRRGFAGWLSERTEPGARLLAERALPALRDAVEGAAVFPAYRLHGWSTGNHLLLNRG
ncbi:hypothetical protein BIV57_16430 [Mangrovactinospora gilvigrisea]|uniref:Uncharacterized protein n=1 Tax=Mangrovactinospora gilvigrisea TaxID=1428644 RepID=A0A1J7C4D5_9ACTN|nr:hypothetical protein [Mangrovactinospora gilvigrisea]OIV36408.1 hypothetical protein BIV57_16430 [Mangrovactinospora gilvigrisea]